MKCNIYFYLISQIAASYYINLYLLPQKMPIYFVLLALASLTYILTSIKNPGFYHISRIEQQTILSQQELAFNRTKKCNECKIDQLIRMKHCQDCKNCVATFDHHCIWVDNCIGQKNRPLFMLCLLTNVIEIGFVMYQLISVMWQKGEKMTSQIIFLSFLGILFSGILVLFGMHIYLMIINLTTRQILRWEKIYYLETRLKKQGSPFSRGLLTNIQDYLIEGFTYKFKVWKIKQKQALNTSQEETQGESRQQTSTKNIK